MMPYYLNLGVDNQVTWPAERKEIIFEGRRIVLLPKTAENTTSIHIDLAGFDIDDARTLASRLLSIMAWCSDNYAVIEGGWAGTAPPLPVRKRNLAFVTAREWPFARSVPKDPRARIALAIYREARNAEQNDQVFYSVLGYFKIMEVRVGASKDARIWIRDNLNKVEALKHLPAVMEKFNSDRGAAQPHNYLYGTCRSAVAHLNEPYFSDPDDSKARRRMHVAADVLRELARHFIKTELKISTHLFDGS
jgi:hypothetical protein